MTTILVNGLCAGVIAFALGAFFRLPMWLSALLGGVLGFWFAHLSSG